MEILNYFILESCQISLWCHLCRSSGMLQVLDARHIEVLPKKILEYEKLGDNKADGDVSSSLLACVQSSTHITYFHNPLDVSFHTCFLIFHSYAYGMHGKPYCIDMSCYVILSTHLNLKSWIAERNIGEPKTSSTKHAVAVSSNLWTNKGMVCWMAWAFYMPQVYIRLCLFYVTGLLKITAWGSKDQQIVSIRMVQPLCQIFFDNEVVV